MDIPLQPNPEQLKRLGSKDGGVVREVLSEILDQADYALYRSFRDSRDAVDNCHIQGAAKLIEELRKALARATPQHFQQQP